MTNLVLKLAEQAKNIGVTAAYGEQQDVDGVKFVPVALSYYGFGAGSEGGDDEAAGGGGGGGLAVPVGAYIKTRDGLRFDPNLISLIAVAIPFIWVSGKALSGIIRALKK
ncbi:hypothetical protein ACL9RL_17370 [Plantibacter sp. Mn2098]|uniref:hypothetical protein n=1 Tax=Plantibacter sp. Mn2098 TaxID=3395266 RepID=UPI003BD16644